MIDRATLENLLGGNKNMVHQFLDIFKKQTPEQLNNLEKFVENKNWDQASITAHAIKSQCKYLGLEEISDNAFKIEQLTEERKQLYLIPGLVVKLKDQILKVIEVELT